MPEGERNRIVDEFKAGNIKVLSNCSLFAEGFDAPATSCMILARPTKSLIRYIQMVGRVLRPSEGKNIALVLDHSGSVARLGFPTDPLPLELDDGISKKADRKEAVKKEPKVCPRCKHVSRIRSKVCKKCGYEHSYQAPKPEGIEHKEGNLQKIVKIPHEAKQAIYSGLVSYATARGYQAGWCQHKYKRITGVWPKNLDFVAGPIPDFVERIILSEQIKYAKRKAA
jgi:superfamily II DNA/RNA helicase